LLNLTNHSSDVSHMCRCVLLMMLLPYVLLTQFALVGHAHCERFPLGHCLRPHIHTGTVTHEINHHHDDDGISDHHHHEDDEVDDVKLRGMAPSETLPDHDLDAIYLAAFDSIPNDRKVHSGESLEGRLLAIPSSIRSGLALEIAGMCLVLHHPPPSRSCSIYIRNLAILI